jgi:hypothetical protein
MLLLVRARVGLCSAFVASAILVCGGTAHAEHGFVPPIATVQASGGVVVLDRGRSFRLSGRHAFVDIDFGHEVVGTVNLKANPDSPHVDVALAEGRVFLGFHSDLPGSAGRVVGEAAHRCGIGRLCSHFGAFRFARIFLAKGATVTISEIGAISQSWAAPSRGSFAASNSQLARIWESSATTLKSVVAPLVTAQSDYRGCGNSWINGKLVILDGAKRDRCPYSADIAVSGLSEFIRSGDATPDRNVLIGLARLQHSNGFIPGSFIHLDIPFVDYPAWWTVSLYDTVLYTGDLALARQLWPNLVRVLDRWYPSLFGADGLISNPWKRNDYAFVPRTGRVVTYYNALYVLALRDAAQLAHWTNEPGHARAWTMRADRFARRINALLWDPKAGAYVDAAGSTAAHPLDGNALALVGGVATPGMSRRVLAFISSRLERPWGTVMSDTTALDARTSIRPALTLVVAAAALIVIGALIRRRYRRLPRAVGYVVAAPGLAMAILGLTGLLTQTRTDFSQRTYPFISRFALEARFAAGDGPQAVNEIRRTWAPMATDPDAPGTTWEYSVGAKGLTLLGPETSLAHGWSTGALALLTNDVLGVRPVAPGFSQFQVAPMIDGLRWARGTVPTPRGPITVTWRTSSSGTSINIRAPKNESALVKLATPASHVSFNGSTCRRSADCVIASS